MTSTLASGQGSFDLDGAIDLHIHTAPCLFPRLGDDVETVQRCADAGLRAVAIKSHHESTVSRARLAGKAVPGIDVIGGITLNWTVGGVNPYAVEAALLTGGRIVWGPSGHAAYHGEIMGGLGSWGIPGMNMPGKVNQGVEVVDENGRLTTQSQAVLDLVGEHDALFATSHISPDEILAVLDYARPRGIRVLVNHVFYLPRVDEEFLAKVVTGGGAIELISALMLVPSLQSDLDYTYARLVATIRRFGAENFVLASDGGGVSMALWPDEQLRMFARLLLNAGLTEAELDQTLRTNPARLIGLST
ncbi:hypothetical protein AU252_01345 [Pseudarthrobacter sulfonivorans]|uniref:Histidinol phosphatase n=1 Tax=Pseudarthrobacter sulfonivorans TaxID=121292 RepID=A0A0U3F7W9_9MICC|nr:DUF6282 family protein [Pseudarthrobacter sulfonivorans]ALV39977.1 hypothetical protein AU252_01345 [Pseudarthrobacter sulfonivorans]